VILFGTTMLPYAVHMSGMLYLVGAIGLGAGFLHQAIVLYRGKDPRAPIRTFGYSIWYLAALFAFLLVDHYV